MNDLFTRALLSGLGLANLTKDAIRKTAEDLVDQSKLSEEEGRRLVKDLHRRSTQAQKAIETKIESSVRKVLKQFNLEIVKNPPKGGKSAGKKSPAKSRRSRGTRKAPSL
jgi:polyhydroxyalkanoate synthesis regulator phasin